jgi:hypothetical protein
MAGGPDNTVAMPAFEYLSGFDACFRDYVLERQLSPTQQAAVKIRVEARLNAEESVLVSFQATYH